MCWLSGLATVGALLCGGIAVTVGLFQKQNRMRPRLWHYLVTLLTIVALLYLLTFGPGNPISLVHIRARALVALTGGQDRLQSWAVEILAKPRDRMQEDGSGWRVPREEWSRQVQRLGGGVRIDPLLEDERCAVCLCYGGGFFHWYIVVGPPGSVPDPKLVERRPYDAWYRWGDGIYGWFPEN
jgi:hypothetical protein